MIGPSSSTECSRRRLAITIRPPKRSCLYRHPAPLWHLRHQAPTSLTSRQSDYFTIPSTSPTVTKKASVLFSQIRQLRRRLRTTSTSPPERGALCSSLCPPSAYPTICGLVRRQSRKTYLHRRRTNILSTAYLAALIRFAHYGLACHCHRLGPETGNRQGQPGHLHDRCSPGGLQEAGPVQRQIPSQVRPGLIDELQAFKF